MSRTSRLGWAVGAVIAAVAAAPAAGAPIAGAPTAIIPGSAGELVVVMGDRQNATGAALYRAADGRRLWSDRQGLGCGNCNGGLPAPSLHPDGTIGPFGAPGAKIWAYNRQGEKASPVCLGVSSADGGCIDSDLRARPGLPIATFEPVIRSHGTGVTKWQTPLAGNPVTGPTLLTILRDRGGQVYVDGGEGRFLVALAAADGRVIWEQRDTSDKLLAPLTRGVLVGSGEELVALGADGTRRWSRIAGPLRAGSVQVDSRRGRVAVQRSRGRVTTLSLRDGAQLWTTPPAVRSRLLAIDSSGRTHLAIDSPARLRGLEVRNRNGRVVTRLRTGRPIAAALPLANRRVALALYRPGDRSGTLTIATLAR